MKVTHMKKEMVFLVLAMCLMPRILSAQATSEPRQEQQEETEAPPQGLSAGLPPPEMFMTIRSDGGTMDEGTFRRMLANNPPASLVLFDTSEKEWGQEFERIRREDLFAILNLNFISFEIYSGFGDEVREREGWQAQKPRWAIFNSKGQMVADGSVLPTSAQLAEYCDNAKIISMVEALKRFLREHPNHEEARGNILKEMVVIAEIRTRNALHVPENRTDMGIAFISEIDGIRTDNPNSKDPTASQIESLPMLKPEEDERIWRDYCVELQRYLEGVLWQSGESGNAFTLDAKPIATAWARFSPITKTAYSKAAIAVENALMRQPSSTHLWRLWVTLHNTGVGKSMKELLADLQPSPSITPANWPPPTIRTPYLQSCRETGDWKSIEELVAPIWESLTSQDSVTNLLKKHASSLKLNLGDNIGDLAGLSQGFWVSNVEAYLEALLRLQRLSDAERLMKTWASGSGWSGAFLAASAIAERLGYESVAKNWREMGERR
jgi:hypothetical protein